jgi:hypothetical protein
MDLGFRKDLGLAKDLKFIEVFGFRRDSWWV